MGDQPHTPLGRPELDPWTRVLCARCRRPLARVIRGAGRVEVMDAGRWTPQDDAPTLSRRCQCGAAPKVQAARLRSEAEVTVRAGVTTPVMWLRPDGVIQHQPPRRRQPTGPRSARPPTRS